MAVTFKYKRPPGMSRVQWIRLASLAMHAVKKDTPVDTGHLRASWSPVSVTQRQLILRNDAPYAEFVNDGTPHMAARDMTGKATSTLNELAGR